MQRIVSLAPHTTELLYSAGAGSYVVATVQYSDYPAAAKQLPRIGDAFNIDQERLLALQPDLVVAWLSGNGTAIIEKVRAQQIPVYVSEPRSLQTIATTINNLGTLAGTETIAEKNSAEFLTRLHQVRQQQQNKKTLRVFFQTWQNPVFTVNKQHLISQVLETCGGSNVFADMSALSSQVSVESVLLTDPDVILASSTEEDKHQVLSRWKSWKQLAAVKNNLLFTVPSEVIARHSIRLLQGMDIICTHLDKARATLP